MVSGLFSNPFGAPSAASENARSESEAACPLLRDFIAGEENRLAQVAASAVLCGDSRYNPLVLSGLSGVGKSHFARGLAADFLQQDAQRQLVVIDGVDFARACASSRETDALADLQRRCRCADFFLLESLDELAARRHAQRELIGTLDWLLRQRRQVVVTSRCSPLEAPWLTDHLRSRLVAGLTVPLKYPGPQTRQTVLQQLVRFHRIDIEPAALKVLTDGLSTSVPRLNQAVVQLAASISSKEIPINAARAARFLREFQKARRPSLSAIVARVARYYKLKPEELKSPVRRQAVVQARAVAMYLARQVSDVSLEQIGRHFGRRDHSTVLHACRKTASRLKIDAATKQAVEELQNQLVAL